MELIDKNTLVGADGLFSKRGCVGNCQHCNLWSEDGCRVILEAPTVDAVEVVHGRWELYPSHMHRRCSVCKVEYDKSKFNIRANYCPNCGAYMRGEL